MAETYGVFVEGLANLKILEDLPADILEAAKRAVNDTVRRSRPAAAKEMEKRVNFPRGYLTGEGGRLTIPKYATDTSLSAILRGRDRPTSLARFIIGGAKQRKRGEASSGVTVEVKPGLARRLPRAFAIKLRNNNFGLAVRTSSGRKPTNASSPKEIAPGLWLLYGPSVDQVFGYVREEIVPDMEDYLEEQFRRQLDLLT